MFAMIDALRRCTSQSCRCFPRMIPLQTLGWLSHGADLVVRDHLKLFTDRLISLISLILWDSDRE
jgi:hypothetical protein